MDNQIETKGKLIGTVNYKPYKALITIAVFAAVLLLIKTTIAIVFSLLLFLLAAAGMFFIKDRPILEVYDNCLVLYNESKQAQIIPLDEITKWDSGSSSFQTVLYLKDPQTPSIIFECFDTGKVINYLKEAIPEKQSIEMGIEIRKVKKKK